MPFYETSRPPAAELLDFPVSGDAAWSFTTPAMYRGMADASGRVVRIYSEEEER